jgi:NADH-quinone oxidoreductase subunit M
MDLFNRHILSCLLLWPLIGCVVVALLPRRVAREAAVVTALIGFVMSLHLWVHWSDAHTVTANGMRFEELQTWLPQFGVSYHLGVDGVSLFLVILTAFLTPLVMLASWMHITQRTKEFMVCLLLLESALIGVFAALDVILFYIFWEAVLIPVYLLIGGWGGVRRIYASIKFFIYTMAGSVLMWIAILYIYFHEAVAQPPGVRSFDLGAMRDAAHTLESTHPQIALWLFAAFALAFAIKVPLFPLHTWLPDAYAEAPMAGTVMLAAVMSKMGAYGFIRFAIPFFPQNASVAAPFLISLAIIGIIYGAMVAIKQTDFKRLIAYSSISHLGFIMLGVFVAVLSQTYGTMAMTGATLQMVNHGISTGALFLLAGMMHERRHTHKLSELGGLAEVMPRYTVLFWIALFASIGLPGLNGFIGEYLILQGTMGINFWYAALATTGVILGAVYMLRMFRSLMFGELTRDENRAVRDVSPRETFVLAAVLAVAVWIGIAPRPFLNIINSDMFKIVQNTQNGPASIAPPITEETPR